MKIFITGASGFVGGHIATALKEQHSILAMARSEKSASKVRALGATPINCDLSSVTFSHLQGCDVVIHSAAFAEEWGSDAEFFSANVTGTANMLKAAKEAGVKRFIFIGTEAAFFKGQDMINIDETYPYADESPYPYSRTKALAEKLVLQANSGDFQTVSLRPRLVWGPKDQSILPAILRMLKAGQFMWISGGNVQTSVTHVDNLVHAVTQALTLGKGGYAYFVTDDAVLSMKEFLSRYIGTQKIEVPTKSVPKGLARFMAWGIESVWRAFGLKSKPPMVRFSIDIMSAHCTINTAKAKRELNFKPVISVDEGMRTMPML